ncbi:hypothetical protein [Pseudoalteromonas rubra]|uniref:Uncharacterized protein n=1 Tax=Pseudoalteromonas rubra TaxID=43658 RepID=A0A0U3HX29_9GAMM|nr:hypothetical protein [Pseudoalteromonas rubra]ALU46153.1 hypothetical protein AT705_24635 [Pseudoalteromonas rubra]
MKTTRTLITTAIIALHVSTFDVYANNIDADLQIPVTTGNVQRLPVAMPTAGATPHTPVVSEYQGAEHLRNAAMQASGEAIPPQSAAQAPNQEPDFLQKIKDTFKPEQSYTLQPGRNVIIPVGQGFNNAIRTNFQSLSVKTSSSVEDVLLEIEGGNLYATLRTMNPVSVLLSEDGVLESEVSVVLVPLSAPPAMVNLTITLSDAILAKTEAYQKELAQQRDMLKARQSEQNQGPPRSSTYANALATVLTSVAQNKTPLGYAMTNDIPPYLRHPCRIAVYHEAGQRLSGNRDIIDIVLVHNDSDDVYHVREEMCINDDVKAVALFPRAYLQPGEETEVYIVRRAVQPNQVSFEQARPRLTLGSVTGASQDD